MNTSIFETYDKYNRDDIMALKGDDLLAYVNTMLQNGYTVQSLCKDKGLRNKTIRHRLNNLSGAVYDQKLKCYVKDSESIQPNYSNNTSQINKKDNDDTISLHLKYNSNTPVSQVSQDTTEEQPTETAVIKDLKDCIINLTNEIISLNGAISEQRQRQQQTPPAQEGTQEVKGCVSAGKFEAIPFTGQPKTRPMKIYPDVLKRLDDFCDQYPQYSKQRVISTLLSQALDMHE